MATIATLNVSVKANTDDYHKKMKGVSKSLKEFQGGFAAVKGALSALGAGFGAYQIIGSIKSLIIEQQNLVDRTSKVAQSIGMSAKALSEYQYAANMVDVEVETLNAGMLKFTENIGKARDGTESAIKPFRSLGIGLKDIQESEVDVLFRKSLASIQSINDPAARMAKSIEVFGKSAKEMAPFLSQNAAALKESAEAAERMGVVIDKATERSVEKLNKTSKVTKSFFQGLANDFLVGLANIDLLPDRFLFGMKGMWELNKHRLQQMGMDKNEFLPKGGSISPALPAEPDYQAEARANLEHDAARRAEEETGRSEHERHLRLWEGINKELEEYDKAIEKLHVELDPFAFTDNLTEAEKVTRGIRYALEDFDASLDRGGIEAVVGREWQPGFADVMNLSKNLGFGGGAGAKAQEVKDPAGLKVWERIAKAVENPRPMLAVAQ